MLPVILAALSMAQKKAQNENQNAQQLVTNPYQQPANANVQQDNGMGNAISSIGSIFGSLSDKDKLNQK